MKKINATETRNINGGCSYSGFNGHRAVALISKKRLWGKTQYQWLCGCGKRFYTYFYG